MTRPNTGKATGHAATRTRRSARKVHGTPDHPRSVPIPTAENEDDRIPDHLFTEGVGDVIDPDLRHRMISEGAYALYARRGYEDGYDVDDWLQAEDDVDHVLLSAPPGAAPPDTA
jgi:predicted acyl esterase